MSLLPNEAKFQTQFVKKQNSLKQLEFSTDTDNAFITGFSNGNSKKH
jgi:hypothetical protein